MNSRAKPRAAAAVPLLRIWMLALLCGCAQQDQSDGNATARPPAPPLSLRVVDVDGYHETLAKLRGDVVLVDFWATWCAPCIKQFPHTVMLHRKYKDRGLAVISVSLNEPSEEPQVRDFLAKQDARFDNLLSKYGGGTEAMDALGLPGPVPYYRVYDRSGELRHEFAVDPRAKQQFTPADIEAAVTELL